MFDESDQSDPQGDRTHNILGTGLMILAGVWLAAYIVVAIRAWFF